MATCKNCGTEIPDNTTFCPACGAGTAPAANNQQTQATFTQSYSTQTNGTTFAGPAPQYPPQYAAPQAPQFDKEDIEKHKLLCIFAYLGVFAIIPLLVDNKSKYVRFHVNQGLCLILAGLVCTVAAIIPVIGWIVMGIGSIFLLVCTILGVVNAFQGKTNELPLIGKYKVIND